MFSVQEAFANSRFEDVPTTHYAYKEINYLYSLNIIHGYSETTFKPKESIKREHAAKLLVNSTENTPLISTNLTFSDVSTSNIYKGYINRVVEQGMMSASNGKFSPSVPITRQDMAKAIAIGFKLDIDKYKNLELPFKDISKSHSYYKYVAALYYNGITQGAYGKFNPTSNVSRADFSIFIARAKSEQYRLDLPVQGVGVPDSSQAIKQVESTTDYLNVRSTPEFSGKSNIVGQVHTGHIFNVYEETTSYYKVDYDGRYAYVFKTYLKDVTTLPDTDDESDLPNHEDESSGSNTQSNTIGIATVDSLNIRSQATHDSASLGKINKGTELEVVSFNGFWAEVIYNGQKGYVNKIYLRLKNKSGSAVANRIIVIDPGHGGKDPGAIGGSAVEKQIVLKVSLKVKEKLEAAGAIVKMTRTGDTYPTLDERVAFSKNNYADTFVSIHVNSATTTSANGTETFYNALSNSDEEAKLAKYINNEIVKNANMNNRDVKKADFKVIKNLAMPAVLVELGFVSNGADRDKLVSDQYAEIFAQSIYNGIVKYYKD